MMTNYFLKLLCRSPWCRTEQQNLQQYNFNKIKQQKACVSPKLKSHWNKNKKCSYCPSFFSFSFFFFFRPHFLVLFSFFFFFFFLIFSTVTRSACIFFQSLICSLIFIFKKFFFFSKSRVNCSFCILHFCLPSMSVLITINFIYPYLEISVIN